MRSGNVCAYKKADCTNLNSDENLRHQIQNKPNQCKIRITWAMNNILFQTILFYPSWVHMSSFFSIVMIKSVKLVTTTTALRSQFFSLFFFSINQSIQNQMAFMTMFCLPLGQWCWMTASKESQLEKTTTSIQ